MTTKRALFLISDTGGGHRSAANALTAALDQVRFGPDGQPVRFEHRIEDVAAHCTFPLSQLGPAYSAALRFAPPIYGALYHATNGRRRFRSVVRFCEPLYRERIRELFLGYRPDVIVSVHPLLNHAALRARSDAEMEGVPVITVVTDLGRVHEGWLVPEVDAIVVPAPEVYKRARARGIPASRIYQLGHPVHPKFEDQSETKLEVRKRLGLPGDATVALLMAGGEGGGKLLPTTLALARARLRSSEAEKTRETQKQAQSALAIPFGLHDFPLILGPDRRRFQPIEVSLYYIQLLTNRTPKWKRSCWCVWRG